MTYNENPILFFNDVDNNSKYFNPRNADLRIVTLEIGDANSVGYSSSTRINQSNEYEKRFKGFLNEIISREIEKNKTLVLN